MPFKDRIEQLKENAKYKKIQQHVKDNQVTYSIVGGASVGVVGMLLLKGSPIGITNSAAPNIAPVFNNMPVFNNDNSSVVNFGGYASKIVQCVEHPEKIWTSVTESALANGDSVHAMSRHLNNHTPDYNGLHYRIIGQTTAATTS